MIFAFLYGISMDYEVFMITRMREVYDDIQSSIGYRTEQRDVTRWAVLAALILGFAAAGFSLVWFARLP